MAIRQPKSRNISYYQRLFNQLQRYQREQWRYSDTVYDMQYQHGQISFDDYRKHLEERLKRYSEGSLEYVSAWDKLQDTEDAYENKVIADATASGIPTRDLLNYFKEKQRQYTPNSPAYLRLDAKVKTLERKARREDENLEELRIKYDISTGKATYADLLAVQIKQYHNALNAGEDEESLISRQREIIATQLKIREEAMAEARERIAEAREGTRERKEHIREIKDLWSDYKSVINEDINAKNYNVAFLTLMDAEKAIPSGKTGYGDWADYQVSLIRNEMEKIATKLGFKILGSVMHYGSYPRDMEEWKDILQLPVNDDATERELESFIEKIAPRSKWGKAITTSDFLQIRRELGDLDPAVLAQYRRGINQGKNYFLVGKDKIDWQPTMTANDLRVVDEKAGIYSSPLIKGGKQLFMLSESTLDLEGVPVPIYSLYPVSSVETPEGPAYQITIYGREEPIIVPKAEVRDKGFKQSILDRAKIDIGDIKKVSAGVAPGWVEKLQAVSQYASYAAALPNVYAFGLKPTMSIVPLIKSKGFFGIASRETLKTIAKSLSDDFVKTAADIKSLRISPRAIWETVKSLPRGEEFPTGTLGRLQFLGRKLGYAAAVGETAGIVAQTLRGRQFRSEAERIARPPEQETIYRDLASVLTPIGTYGLAMGVPGAFIGTAIGAYRGVQRVGELKLREAELTGKGKLIEQLSLPAYSSVRRVLLAQGFTPDRLAEMTEEEIHNTISNAIRIVREAKQVQQQGRSLTPIQQIAITAPKTPAPPPPRTGAAIGAGVQRLGAALTAPVAPRPLDLPYIQELFKRKQGFYGSEIESVQRFLEKEGLLKIPKGQYGWLGKRTISALREYQKRISPPPPETPRPVMPPSSRVVPSLGERWVRGAQKLYVEPLKKTGRAIKRFFGRVFK